MYGVGVMRWGQERPALLGTVPASEFFVVNSSRCHCSCVCPTKTCLTPPDQAPPSQLLHLRAAARPGRGMRSWPALGQP
jgi:hypothetical protein